jgi:quercetin dioxygenase-like cupin family protein
MSSADMAPDRSKSQITRAAVAVRYSFEELSPLPDKGQGTTRGAALGENMLIVEIRGPAGARGETHSHSAEEQITYIVSGRVRLWSGEAEEEMTLLPGDIAVIPAGVPHRVEILEDSGRIEIFSPPLRVALGYS